MEEEIFILTLVIIACATGLIKAWINRLDKKNGVDEESFNRLARAFMKHKTEMKKRVQQLETVIDEENNNITNDYQQIEAPEDDNSLTNDLQEKNKVQQ